MYGKLALRSSGLPTWGLTSSNQGAIRQESMPFLLMHSIGRTNLFEGGSAVFSGCGRYRYRLDRSWNTKLPPISFGMLNPSTADHERNDATIERCERRARSLGYGSLVVWNLFAFRATNPSVLKEQTDPIGPENDDHIRDALLEIKARGGIVIVAWGAHGSFLNRPKTIQEIADRVQISFLCLGITSCGQPKHPLYVSYKSQPSSWCGGCW